ncbi:hypothetical protein [Sphaerisporangium aureirubrum]|uniref:Ricin B lectin domain-containing protein n=1 Tax=Sphaerisporangium aureirubrum TaxID=1544736 RepID=A0ABW1NG41_9ACTN
MSSTTPPDPLQPSGAEPRPAANGTPRPARRRIATLATVLALAAGALVALPGLPGTPPALAATPQCPPEGCGNPGDPDDPPQLPNPDARTTRVMSLGDSYAAGQGAPNLDPDAYPRRKWVDDACYRSELSGIRQVLKQLRTTSPYGDDFTHYDYTCSGAAVESSPDGDGGILTPQRSAGTAGKDSQIDQANAEAGDRIIDVLTIGAGGNDTGFVPIIEACAQPFNNCGIEQIASDHAQWRADLRGKLDRLITAIQGDADGNGKTLRARVRDVYWATYPDMTKTVTGAYCYEGGGLPYEFIDGLETRWISTAVIGGLNDAIRAAVTRANADDGRPGPRWHVVEQESWSGHAWCDPADRKYVNNVDESQAKQDNIWGAAHPNEAGYRSLAAAYLRELSYLNRPYPAADRFSVLLPRHTGAPAVVAGASRQPGAEVRQGPSSLAAAPHAAWRAARLRSYGRFALVSALNGLCVTTTGTGAAAVTQPCAEATGQRFDLKPEPAGTWVAVAYGARDCLGVRDGAGAADAPYTVSPCTFAAHQSFTFRDAYSQLSRYNNQAGDHHTETATPGVGWTPEGVLGLLPVNAQAGTLPLTSCRIGSDHFTSTDPGCEGHEVVRLLGHIHTAQPSGTASVALYRCVVHGGGDHFDSTDPACEGRHVDGRLGYLPV